MDRSWEKFYKKYGFLCIVNFVRRYNKDPLELYGEIPFGKTYWSYAGYRHSTSESTLCDREERISVFIWK